MLTPRDMYVCAVKQTKPHGGRDESGNPVLWDVPFLVVATDVVKDPKTGAATRWLRGLLVDPRWLEDPTDAAAVAPRVLKLPHGDGVNQARDVLRETDEAKRGCASAEAKERATATKALELARELERERGDHKRAREREAAAGQRADEAAAQIAKAEAEREALTTERDELLKDAGEHVKALQARVAELEARVGG